MQKRVIKNIVYSMGIAIIALSLMFLFTSIPQIEESVLSVEGVALAASTVDENTKTLTASIYPESTIDKSVDWHVEWADPDCASANDQVLSISGGVAYDYLQFDTSYSGSFGYITYIQFESGAVLRGNGSELVLTSNGTDYPLYYATRWESDTYFVGDLGRVVAYNTCTFAKGVISAKTVTSYVKVTPDEDGSLNATVKCVKPFSDPIKVVVTARTNRSATAYCVAQYAKRTTVSFTPASVFGSTKFSESSVNTVKCADTTASYSVLDDYLWTDLRANSTIVYSFSSGTLVPVPQGGYFEARPSEELYAALQEQGIALDERKFYQNGSALYIAEIYNAIAHVTTYSENESQSASVYSSLQKFCNAVASCTGEYDFELRFTWFENLTTESGSDLYTRSVTYKCKFDRSVAPFIASSAEVSETEIVF